MAASFAHPVTPVLIKTLMLEDYMFGLALACMLCSNFLFSPFWGKISSYVSSRNTLLVGSVGYAAGQWLFAMAQTQAQFLFARFFAGIFVGGAFVSILTYIVNTAPQEQRGKYLTITATLQAVMGSLGYFVGGMLGEIHVSVAVFAQVGTLAACGVLFRLVCAPDATQPLDKASPGKLIREANPFRAFAQGRQIMSVSLALLFVVCAMQNLSQTAFDQSFNYYAIDQMGFSTGNNGAVKFVMGIVTLIANSTLCAWLMRRTDTRKSVIFVMLSCLLCITAVLLVRDLTPFLIFNVLYYALSAITIPLTQSLVADTARGQDGNLVMGFYNSLKALGGIIGALLAGFTYVVNPMLPFICCGVGYAVATACAVQYSRRT